MMNQAQKQTSHEPQDLGCKLFYFRGIENDSHLAGLNGKLLLTLEDNQEKDESLGHSNFIFGYILNQPSNLRLRQYMKEYNQTLSHKFNFVQIMDGSVDFLETHESDFITFLMERSDKFEIPGSDRFGPFSAYLAEDMEEAKHIAEYLSHKEGVITLHSQVMMDRYDLLDLMNRGQALSREADLKAILNTSAHMRVTLSFPQLAA